MEAALLVIGEVFWVLIDVVLVISEFLLDLFCFAFIERSAQKDKRSFRDQGRLSRLKNKRLKVREKRLVLKQKRKSRPSFRDRRNKSRKSREP